MLGYDFCFVESSLLSDRAEINRSTRRTVSKSDLEAAAIVRALLSGMGQFQFLAWKKNSLLFGCLEKFMTGRSKKDLFGIIHVLLFLKTTVIRASPILLPLLADWFASWQPVGFGTLNDLVGELTSPRNKKLSMCFLSKVLFPLKQVYIPQKTNQTNSICTEN